MTLHQRKPSVVIKRIAALAICFMVAAVAALAQTTSGRFVITVKDQTGGVIAGATVKVKNVGTNQETTGVTGEGGSFTTQLLPVGRYELTVEATNFRTSLLGDLKLDVGQEYGVSVTLEPGEVGEVVTISGGEQLVQSTTAEVRSTISQRQTQELPLAARNPLALVQLQAGVNGNQSRTNTTINGQRASSTLVTQDGINIQDIFIRANGIDFSPNLPTVASVAEATVITQNATADVAGSSAVRFVTPSGTNEYHGEVFEFHRNSATAANSFFNNASGVGRPQLIRNQFGFTFGGPVGIPGLGKSEKLFFFTSYEGFRQRTQAGLTTTVLLPNARQGVFTYQDNSGATRTINLLTLRNITMDPVTASLINRIPNAQANIATVGDGLNTSGFRFNRSTPTDRNAFTTRIDYNINSKNQLQGIYRYSRERVVRGDIDQTFNTQLQVDNSNVVHFGSAALITTFSSRLNNEIRVGTNLSDPKFNVTGDQPSFFVGGLPFTNPDVTFLPQGRTSQITQVIDNAAFQAGAHNIRFGVQFDVLRNTPFNFAGTVPTIGIGQQGIPQNLVLTAGLFPGGINATQLNTANNFLALYLGSVANANRTFNATSQTSGFVNGAANVRRLKVNQYAGYITDQWRIHPRVTINMGLRYDYITPVREANNLSLIPEINADTPAGLVLNPNNRLVFVSGGFYQPDRDNFAPNVSVAWDVPGLGEKQTVLRGGYSISYINDETVQAANNSLGTNNGLSSTVAPPLAQLGTNPTLGGSSGSIIGGPLGAPAFSVPLTFAQVNQRFGPGSALGVPSQDLKTPYYQQYNIGVERELTKEMSLTVRYVGNRSTTLVRGVDLNQVDVTGNGFAADVARARQNGFLAQQANPAGGFNPVFNAAIPGSQPLTVLNLTGAPLGNAQVRGLIQRGEAGSLASLLIQNRLTGTVQFAPNPNVLAANILNNSGFSNYNAFQVEIRRRFAKSAVGDYAFQANYTYGKVLTNTDGTGQTRFEALLDNGQPTLENSRAPFDVRHSFKFNGIYELPFGPGKTFNPSNRILRKLVEGFQVATFFEIASGAPFSILSSRGTLNRAVAGAGNRGDLTPADSSLTADQIRDLFGFFRQGGNIFYIDPRVLFTDGRAVQPDGQSPFNGQVFFNPEPGRVGSLQRFQFDSPRKYNVDLSIFKRTRVTERIGTEFRAEFFNVFNNVVFDVPSQNINSPTFGRFTTQFNAPRFIQFALKVTF
jgi:hypothetical protein